MVNEMLESKKAEINEKINIVIIGMPGSGKTTICQELATMSKKEYVDVDFFIERQCNKKIPQIFAQYGEEYFRKLESEMIQSVSIKKNAVISTGGGCVKNKDNIDNLKKNAIIIYVKRDLEKLETSGRPLSSGGIESVKKLFEERKELYEKYSDFQVENNTDISDCVGKIYRVYLDYINQIAK